MINKLKYNILMVSAIGAGLVSCTDEFDNHYNQSVESTGKLDVSCMQYLEDNSEFAAFVEMIKAADYELALSSAQNYTVWAPTNSVLADARSKMNDASFMAQNPDYIKNIVESHIALFSYTTSGLSRKAVRMKNGKIHIFEYNAGSYSIGEQAMSNVGRYISQGVNNGVIYRLEDSLIPYRYNIFEYIGEAPGLDSMKAFLYSYNEKELDKNLSVEIGIDGNGEILYDTVWKDTNIILDRIGDINVEDSIYTTLLLNNDAWTKSYERVRSSYNFDPAELSYTQQEADSITRYYAGLRMVQHLVFRNVPENIAQLTNDTDSIFAVSKTSFLRPARLFENIAHTEEVSNGIVHVLDSVPFTVEETYQPKMTLFAANADALYGREVTTYPGTGTTEDDSFNLFTRSYIHTYTNKKGEEVSENVSYLLAQGISGFNYPIKTPGVKFYIPNVLSASYNIYCKFIPDTINNLPYLVGFDLKYNQDNRQVSASELTDMTFEISTDQTEPVLVLKNFKFPYCNLSASYTGDYDKLNTKVILEVKSLPQRREEGRTYTKDLMIESIIFEPVE